MQPNGANKNIVDHAIFSNDGPNLNNPEDTKIPKVIPNNGIAIKAAGTNPIRVLINADEVKAKIISEIFKGETNKLMMFLLQISSKKSML